MSDATASQAAAIISNTLTTLTGTFNNEAFRVYGLSLLGALAGGYVAYVGIKHILTQKPVNELLAEIVSLFITLGLALWIVQSTDLFGMIVDGFDYLAVRTLSIATGMAITSTETGYSVAVASLLTTTFNLFNPEADGLVSFDSIAALGETGLILLIKFFISVFVLAITLAYLATYTATQIMLLIAAIMAPLMVPFYVVPPFSFIGESWFRFVVSAGFQKLAGALIFGITLGTVRAAEALSQEFAVSTGMRIGLFAVVFIMLGILGFLMKSAMAIGYSLVSGTSRVGQFAPGQLQPASVGAAASSSASSGIRGAGRGAGTAAGALVGAVRAARRTTSASHTG